MALKLEGISVVFQLSKIYAVYEGGKEAFWRDNQPSEDECDGELIRMSFQNPIDAEVMIEDWKKRGLRPTRKQNGKTYWQDMCVVDFFNGPTLPCAWLEFDPEGGIARLSPGIEISCMIKEEQMQEALHLTKLECYQEFIRNPENLGGKCGVYIWGFRFFDPKSETTSGFIPHYVGKHRTNIHRRIREHIFSIREGRSKILYSKLLPNSQFYSSQESEHHAFVNKEDKKRSKNLLPPEERVALSQHVDAYLDNFYVSYIDINHLGLEKEEANKYVDRLERYIQEIIGLDRLSCRSGVKLPADFRPKLMTSKGTEHILNNYPLA